MKEDVTELAVKIHVHCMEVGNMELPEFDYLYCLATAKKEVENYKDLHFIAYVIEEVVCFWDFWTAEWLIEDREAKSQQADEDLLRGEI